MIVRVRRSAKLDAAAAVLGATCGYSAEEAMGRLIRLWGQCLEDRTEYVAETYVRAHLGPRGVEGLEDAGLGERSEGYVRVRGARYEIGQGDRRSEAARRAGFASGRARSGSANRPEPNEQRTPRSRHVNAESTEREREANENSTAYRSDLFSEISSSSQISEASASSENPEEPKRKRKVSGPMPADFRPTDGHRSIAAERGLNVELEVERCRDHFLGKGQPMTDWNAVFRNWLRSAYNRPATTGRSHGSAAAFDLAMEAEARERARSER